MSPFLKKILQNYKSLIGLEVYINRDNKSTFHLVELQKKRDELKLIKKSNIVDGDLNTLLKEIPEGTPVFILLQGKGILLKKAPLNFQTASQILNHVLPNANAEDFIFKYMEGSTDHQVVLARKAYVQDLIKPLIKAGLNIVDFTLGPLSLQFILPLIKAESPSFYAGQYEVLHQSNLIQDIQPKTSKNNDSTLIGDEVIPSEYILSFSAAFMGMLNLQVQGESHQYGEDLKENFLYKKLFRWLGIGGLLSIFTILLINFLLFSFFNQENAKLSTQMNYHQNQIIELQQLQKTMEQKKDFIQQNNFIGSSKISFYGDQIAASLPSGIKLKKVDFFPTTANQKRTDDIFFNFDTSAIFIQGESDQSFILNSWIRTLGGFDWLQKVEVLPYTEKNKGLGVFELKLILSDKSSTK